MSVTRGDSTLTAEWPAAAGAASYHITYSPDGGQDWYLAAFEHTATTITIHGVSNDTTYVVGVRARNGGGYSNWRNSPPAAAYVPVAAPANLTIKPGDGYLDIEWDAVTGATGYDIQAKAEGSASWHAVVSDITATSHRYTTAETIDYLAVRARNSGGTGPWTEISRMPADDLLTDYNGDTAGSAAVSTAAGASTSAELATAASVSPASNTLGQVTWGTITREARSFHSNSTFRVGWTEVSGADGYNFVCSYWGWHWDPCGWSASNLVSYGTVPAGQAQPLTISHFWRRQGPGKPGKYSLANRHQRLAVRAVKTNDPSAAGPWAQTEEIRPFFPIIRNLTYTRGDGQITMNWTPNFWITGYDIDCAVAVAGQAAAYTRCATLTDQDDTASQHSVTISSWTAGGTTHTIDNNRTYDIAIYSTNKWSRGQWLAPLISPITAPDKFTSVDAARGNGTIALTVRRPPHTWITSYDIQCSTNSGTTWSACSGSPVTANLNDADNDRETLTITGQANATAYQMRARGTNAVGTSGWSDTVDIPAISTPARIGTITATRGDSTITVSWAEPSGGWLAYDIQCSTDSGTNWTATCTRGTGSTTGGTYTETLTGISNTTTYTVRARAKNVLGTGSWRTSASVATTTKPPTPSLSVAPGEKGAGKLTLSGALSANGRAAVTKWQFRRKTGVNTYGAWADIANASGLALTHVVSGLTNGTSYTYQVRAQNSVGWSDPSSDATSTPVNLPGTPTGFYVGGSRNGYVFLVASVNSNGSDLIRWEYKCRRTTGESFAAAWSPMAHTGTYLDRRVIGLENGTSYSCKVRAVTAAGPGPESAVSTGTPQQGTQAPKVVLSLSPSTVSEGGTVTVTASFPWATSSTAATTVNISVTPSTASASDYTLSQNLRLTIPAYAQSSTGTVTIATTGDALDESNETLTVSATASNSSTQGVRQPDSVTLTINDNDTSAMVLSKSDLEMTEGDTDGTYTVRLATQPTHSVTVTPISADTAAVTVSPSSLTFTTTNWNTPQTVTVTAVHDADGTSANVNISHRATSSDSKYSSLAAKTLTVAIADDEPPGAQAAPTWVPGATSLDVSWSAPSYVGSGSATITGYEVRRKENSGSTWTTVTPSPANSTTATISSLTAATLYDLQVRAKNNGNFWGPWSATTNASPGTPTAPTSLIMTPGDQKLTVTWSSPTTTNGSTIIAYNVVHKCGSSSEVGQLVQGTTAELTGLTNGVSCDVRVAALALVGANYAFGPQATATATPTAGS